MVDYVREVQPLETAGKSDEQIAAYLSAVCNGVLDCQVVITMCSQTGLVARNLDTERLGGPLWDALRGSDSPMADWFLRHVWMDRASAITLDGSQSDVPGIDPFDVVLGFAQLAMQLGQASPAFEQLRVAMIQAAGGLQHPEGVSPQKVAASRKSHYDQNLLTNAKLLFNERMMTLEDDPKVVWEQAVVDAGA